MIRIYLLLQKMVAVIFANSEKKEANSVTSIRSAKSSVPTVRAKADVIMELISPVESGKRLKVHVRRICESV